MHPEKELRADHQAIRRTLSVLEGLTYALREGHAISDTDLRRLVSWTEELATHHHEGAEQAAFDMLSELPDGPARGTFRELDEQHEETLAMLEGIDELVDPATRGDGRARNRIAERTDRFVEAMNELLRLEEDTYLTDLDSSLSRTQLDELSEQFEDAEAGDPSRERIERNVDRLADRYERFLGS